MMRESTPGRRLAGSPALLLAVLLSLTACEREAISPPAAPAAVAAPSFALAASATARPDIVISQVYGGGGNTDAPYTHDFVELFNPGTAPVDIAGWRGHYSAATNTGGAWNTASNITTLPAGVIEPGHYYLIRLAGGSTGAPLPEADATGTVNMAAGSAKLILARPEASLDAVACPDDAGIVDRLSYGSTNCGSTWTTTLALSNLTAAIRGEAGCTHTGDAAADFARDTPTPRNSASPARPCDGPVPGGEPAAVTVIPYAATLDVGATTAFTAAALDADGNLVATSFTWSSADADIATVHAATGLATGVSAGVVAITATASNGVSGSATLTVTVPAPPADADVVISQVYGGGGNSSAPLSHDFVELFNRGTQPVNLAGWTLRYTSSSGTTWNSNVTVIQTGTIQPGRYFLVQLASNNTSVGAPLPAPDATGTTNMAGASGKLVLTSADVALETVACPAGATIVDRVNYGAGNCTAWGTTPPLSNTTAALRLDDGCAWDPASHSGHFEARAPAPRNSASPKHSCQGPATITISPADAAIVAGEAQAFTVTAVDAAGDVITTSVAWSSSDPAVASVDAETGVATGLAPGTALITATAANGVAGSASLAVAPAPPRTGLVITEFMADPVGADVLGEWFEVFNAGADAVDLHGWQIQSRSSTGLELHTIAASVIVPAGGFVVLGNNADAATNGGVPVAYSYGGDIILNNSNTDWFLIRRPDGTTEDSVAYSARSHGDVLGTPQYTPVEGVSRVLVDVNLDNSVAASANWTHSTLPYGDGRNLGSPGWGAYGTAGAIASIRVVPGSASLVMGQTTDFIAIALDALGRVSTESLAWSSSDAAIASIDAAGTATGSAEGSVEIRATSASGVIGTATLTVVHPDAPFSITVGVADPNWVPVGYNKRVFATVRNFNDEILPPEVTWSVDDPAHGYFQVWDGRTYFVTTGAGTAWIRATTANGVTGVRSLTILPADAPTPAVYRNHLEFGMPVRTDGGSDGVVIHRPGHSLSYNVARGGPDWVSWNLNATQFGPGVARCNCFSFDPLLPDDERRINDSDFIGSGYDRGHMVQSESRTTTEQENAATYLLSNILPQAPVNNQVSWYAFESYNNTLARQHGRELYVVAGGEYSASPQTLNGAGRVQIPEFTWKIAVIMDAGQGLADVRTPDDLEVIAIRMPNLVETAQNTSAWQNFTTTVASIQEATGYEFLTALPAWIRSGVLVGNRRPTAHAGGPYSGVEGSPVNFDGGASSDPDDGDVLSFSWDFGDGRTATGTAPTHTFLDNGSFAVRLIVSDVHGWADTTFTTATIANAPPVITNVAVTAALPLGSSATATVTWTDPGILDSHEVTVDWGDGTVATVAGSDGTATLTHRYAATGFYTVTATVTDSDGDADSRTAGHDVVVYNPDGAVSGGGTVQLPAGALPAQPAAAGRGSLALTARYTGTGAIEGAVELYFRDAGFRFTADALDWLAVEGDGARLRGSGRIDGRSGVVTFTLEVRHGSGGSGRARLVVTDAAGAVVFDSLPGGADGVLAPVQGSVSVTQ
jgi:DNA/RNA endonuclease G (NUC1)/uncharacterized protein YjdB